MNFLQQFAQLSKTEPRMAAYNFRTKNCEYCNFLADSENCYYCFNSSRLKKCAYCYYCDDCTNGIDLNSCTKVKNCSECSDCNDIKNCNFLINCVGCTDCHLSENLSDCENCLGCVGLNNKKYHIFNIDYKNKSDYQNEKQRILDKFTPQEILDKLVPLKKVVPRPNMILNNCSMSAGDYLTDSTLSQSCYNSSNLDLAAYTMDTANALLSCDNNNCTGIGNSYDCMECSNLEFGKHCFFVTDSKFMTLCAHCFNCENCIGCINLKNKKFHILNKPYSEKEYKKISKQIIKEVYSKGGIQLSNYYSLK